MNRTRLTMRRIRAYNAFLRNCIKNTESDDLVHLYESMIIRTQSAQIGHTVLKG